MKILGTTIPAHWTLADALRAELHWSAKLSEVASVIEFSETPDDLTARVDALRDAAVGYAIAKHAVVRLARRSARERADRESKIVDSTMRWFRGVGLPRRSDAATRAAPKRSAAERNADLDAAVAAAKAVSDPDRVVVLTPAELLGLTVRHLLEWTRTEHPSPAWTFDVTASGDGDLSGTTITATVQHGPVRNADAVRDLDDDPNFRMATTRSEDLSARTNVWTWTVGS